MAGDSFITRLQDELQSGDAQFWPHFQVPGISVDAYARGGWRVWDMVASLSVLSLNCQNQRILNSLECDRT